MKFSNGLKVAVLLVLTLVLGLLVSTNRSLAKADAVKVGDKAPDFTMPCQDGTNVSLKEFAGKKSVVLYFYPKDNTSICTKEACLFKDQFAVFTEQGAVVLGVSSDSVESHKNFAAEQHLPFKLLSDSEGSVRKLYGVASTMGVMPGRVTYVIDSSGTVRLVFNSQLDAQKHVNEALKVLKEIDSKKANS